MIYYVDSIRGSDNNNGLSRETAWRSIEAVNSRTFVGGDEIYFRAGQNYGGRLFPKRVHDGKMIRFGAYGVGDKPEIIADGKNALDLFDFDFVDISGLSFTSPKGTCGICIRNDAGGALKHIHINNCKIHGVNEERKTFAYESGGIIMVIASREKPAWLEDIVIEDNEITDVARSGILHTNLWACRPKMWGFNDYDNDDGNWWPSKGVVIRGNYIDRTGGDGIVLLGTDGALIEWNTVYHVMTNPKPPCANAGIWPQSSNDCLIQYNEVGYCQKPEGCNDAQGYDVDLSCRNTIIQYNYSHDNAGGFLLLCEKGTTKDEDNYRGTIVRNNLSVNDGNVKGELIAMVGPVRGVLIENNTIYSTGNVNKIIEVWTQNGENQAKEVKVRNNLFVSNGRNNDFHLCNGEKFKFENNLYWGTHKEVPSDHVSAAVFDPKLSKSGACGNGRGIMSAYIPSEERLFDAAAKPLEPAPCDALGNKTDGKAYIGAFIPVTNKFK